MSSQAVALCEAAARGDLDFIKIMVLNGADLNEGEPAARAWCLIGCGGLGFAAEYSWIPVCF